LRPPIVTVTVEAGDTLSEIAAAHGLTFKALLAFPENAKYRANPGLMHRGDIVRVKWPEERRKVNRAAFGLQLGPDQIGAILAVMAVILGLITRSRVIPES
jgi:hypothetical protein